MLIVEPVMGEGGYVPLPMEYYRGLREYTKKHGIVFVVDEIQSGFGRTGKPFAFQHYEGVEAPDAILFAKGVANGIPLSGIVAQKAFTARQVPGQQGGTYAGNALACAVANEVIATMKEEQTLANVDARGAQLMNGLKDMIRRNPTAPVAEIRGRGLMIGIEFDANATGVASAFVEACTARNLIVMTTSKYEVVRLIPPLNVTEGECAAALTILEEALVEATSKKQAARQLNGKQFTGFFADGDAGSTPIRYVPQFA
jgi:4-aminobutyrate aminotransferase